MDKATASQSSQAPAATSAAAAAQSANPPVAPVRSAKDAINAMYAQGSNKRLSDYLATSAKDIINNNRASDNRKSATSLHRNSLQHKMESARPSASGMLRMAKSEPQRVPSDLSASMDPLARKTAPAPQKRPIRVATEPAAAPVVKTSLKLKPKKAPITVPPQNLQNPAHRPSVAASPKGQTALAKLLANRQRANSATTTAPAPSSTVNESVRVLQQAAQKVTQKAAPSAAQPVAKPQRRTSRGLMQDIVRPRRRPVPADSVKQRFQAAPRDYTANTETQASAYAGFAQPGPEPATPPVKQPVEIYGMMDEEPAGKSDRLGVVEDYHPQNSTPAPAAPAPDNNKYSIAGQSPFFLKSVTVEKRPLSNSAPRRSVAPEGTLYERPNTDPVSKKNHYDAKPPKETKKSVPTKPTVIIPASRRSHAPFIFLLILTIILGAAVGAFIYLCFFQYME